LTLENDLNVVLFLFLSLCAVVQHPKKAKSKIAHKKTYFFDKFNNKKERPFFVHKKFIFKAPKMTNYFM